MKVTEGYRLPQPHGCSDEAYTLMMKCWARRATERPSFGDIVKTHLDPLATKLARSAVSSRDCLANTVLKIATNVSYA